MAPLLPPSCAGIPFIPEGEVLAIEFETLVVRPVSVLPGHTPGFSFPPVLAHLAKEASSWMGI
jgi:hypothetical protein